MCPLKEAFQWSTWTGAKGQGVVRIWYQEVLTKFGNEQIVGLATKGS